MITAKEARELMIQQREQAEVRELLELIEVAIKDQCNSYVSVLEYNLKNPKWFTIDFEKVPVTMVFTPKGLSVVNELRGLGYTVIIKHYSDKESWHPYLEIKW